MNYGKMEYRKKLENNNKTKCYDLLLLLILMHEVFHDEIAQQQENCSIKNFWKIFVAQF